MKLFLAFLFSLLGGTMVFSQEKLSDTLALDSHYREDQFYLAVTYNLLLKQPKGISQYNFSRSFMGGFIRDFPLNKARNVGFGTGVGYSYNLVFTNIRHFENRQFVVVNQSKEGISKNYFSYHGVEIPLEVRIRTSTAASHKFWRLYTGLKPSFYFASKQRTHISKTNSASKVEVFAHNWNLNCYTSVGYNTWNVFLQYSFMPFLKEEKAFLGENLQMPLLQIGIIFYIL